MNLDFNIADLGTLDVSQGGSWEPIEAGKYTFEVDSAEWTNAKSSGKPMLVVTFIGLDGEATGRQYVERVVLTIKRKGSNREELHFNLPLFAKASGAKNWSDDKDKRAAIITNEKWFDNVAKGLVGKRATIDIIVEPGRPYIDREGNEREGSPQNRARRIEFATKKSSASSITL